ncbi:hypothetical protein HGRIS_000080 [Hohenbuehelia grisea]|uniref:Uncharacterized protein n=1 Tax=Hohenbuehelia grisea TaxID=104357 RepID=A0ABR3JPZ6_9AGAR
MVHKESPSADNKRGATYGEGIDVCGSHTTYSEEENRGRKNETGSGIHTREQAMSIDEYKSAGFQAGRRYLMLIGTSLRKHNSPRVLLAIPPSATCRNPHIELGSESNLAFEKG